MYVIDHAITFFFFHRWSVVFHPRRSKEKTCNAWYVKMIHTLDINIHSSLLVPIGRIVNDAANDENI